MDDNDFLDRCLEDSKRGKVFTGAECARLCALFGDEEMAEKYRRDDISTPIDHSVMTDIVRKIRQN